MGIIVNRHRKKQQLIDMHRKLSHLDREIEKIESKLKMVQASKIELMQLIEKHEKLEVSKEKEAPKVKPKSKTKAEEKPKSKAKEEVKES